MDTAAEQWRMIGGNLALTQVRSKMMNLLVFIHINNNNNDDDDNAFYFINVKCTYVTIIN